MRFIGGRSTQIFHLSKGSNTTVQNTLLQVKCYLRKKTKVQNVKVLIMQNGSFQNNVDYNIG